jgi:hypothetical protein
MRKRRRTGDDAINASERSRFSALGDALWSAQDWARTGSRHGAESLDWTIRRWLLWPLRDRAEMAGAPARALGVCALALLAAGAGVAALLWAAPDDGKGGPTTAAQVAVVEPATAVKVAEPPEEKPGPTLKGAAPDFGSAGSGGIAAEPGKAASADATAAGAAASSSSSAGRDGSAAGGDATAATPSSNPGSSSAAAGSASTSAAKQRPERGPVAGPKAVAVARDFAGAFVSYEIGGAEDPAVQDAFEATTTPQLSQALLRRPPSLPASVKVPKAKVLNVVPAPSHDGVFPVSVSLLRVGTTSELRLEMEKLKGKRWRVTNVLG